MNINNPLNQKSSRSVFNFCLHFLKVVWRYHAFNFVYEHYLINVLGKLGNYLWVPVVQLVTQWHGLHIVFFILLFSLSENLANRFVLNVQSFEFGAMSRINFFFVHFSFCHGVSFRLVVLSQLLGCLHLTLRLLRTYSVGRLYNCIRNMRCTRNM